MTRELQKEATGNDTPLDFMSEVEKGLLQSRLDQLTEGQIEALALVIEAMMITNKARRRS